MDLGGGDRRRIDILQGRNRLKGAQNNILRLKGSSLVSLTIVAQFFYKINLSASICAFVHKKILVPKRGFFIHSIPAPIILLPLWYSPSQRYPAIRWE